MLDGRGEDLRAWLEATAPGRGTPNSVTPAEHVWLLSRVLSDPEGRYGEHSAALARLADAWGQSGLISADAAAGPAQPSGHGLDGLSPRVAGGLRAVIKRSQDPHGAVKSNGPGSMLVVAALLMGGTEPRRRPVARVPVVFGRSAGPTGQAAPEGVTGVLELREFRSGPTGLYPDPRTMAGVHSPNRQFATSLGHAWNAAGPRREGRCVLWRLVLSDEPTPPTQIDGPSLGAAFALGLRDLLSYPPSRRPSVAAVRGAFYGLRPRTAVTGALDGGERLLRVADMDAKLLATRRRRLRLVAPEANRLDVAGAPAPEDVRFAADLKQADRYARRLRTGRLAVAGLVLIASTTGMFALQQRDSARAEQQEALRQRDLVRSNQVLAAADRLRGTDVSAAAQLTLAVHRTHPSGGTYSRLVAYGNTPLSTPVTAHRAGVCALAVSPDGRTLATGSNDYTVRLWDISDPTRPTSRGEPLVGFGNAVCALAFSPNGRTLATGSFDRTVRLWNVSDPDRAKPLGSPLTGYDKTTGSVRALAFSPDGRVLATGSYPRSGVAPITDPGLRLWDVSAPARPRPLSQTVQGAEYIDHLAFTPDGRTLVTSPAGMAFRLWNISDPKRPKALDTAPAGHSAMVYALALSPDGRTVVTGSTDQTLRVWDVSDPNRVKALGRPVAGPTRGVKSLRFSRDGRTLAAAAGDSTISLWNMSDRTAPASLGAPLTGHTRSVEALAFTPDGRTLVGGDGSPAMRLWSLPARLLTGRTLGYSIPNTVNALAFSPTGRTLVSGHFDKALRWWNVSDPARPVSLRPPVTKHTYTVCASAFSPDGRTLATGSRDRTVLIWDVTDPKRPKALRKLIGHPGGVCALDFSPDGRTLATGSEAETAGTGNGSMFLWDVSDPARPQPLKRPRIDIIGGINALDFSPDGRALAAAARDSRVRLWDVSERTRAVPLGEPLSGAGVATLAFSPDGQTLAGGGSGAVRLWEVSDPRRPRALKPLTGFAGHISTTVFSPDGRTLATSEGSTVRLWEVSHPQQAAPLGEPLEGHTGDIHALAFSPDGRTLASGGNDQEIRLWDMDLGEDIKRICAVTRNTPAADVWSRHVGGDISLPAPPC
ncbi:WD40 repeat domain-containing protein [Streptomyces sp. NPDC020480]|uniref:WD40 repeat domain-containing protein n=1 Tax=Streptomyces sp. NPDC020480 TaxID=3365076 RepID=UPI0037AF7D45